MFNIETNDKELIEVIDGKSESAADFRKNLLFAAIISLFPQHPSVQMTVDYCLSLLKPDGLKVSENHVTTEGCYTLAYPIAQFAIVMNDRDLAGIALDQLVHRIH